MYVSVYQARTSGRMTLSSVIVQFGALYISLVTSYGFRNCIQKYEDYHTFTCMNRMELSIDNVVSDIPATARHLNISRNNITVLPYNSFSHLPHLQSLVLHYNYLREVNPGAFKNLSALTYLDLSCNYLHTLPLGIFDGLENLTQLLLNNNTLYFIHYEAFRPLLNLKSLNLSANSLSNFSHVVQVLQPLSHLQSLSLCRNNISHLHHTQSLPSKLSTLFLCQNHLQDLKCHQDFLVKIRYLDLSFNNITSSSLQNVNLSDTNYLTVAFNPDFDILRFLENPTIPPQNIDYSGLNLNTSYKLRIICSHLRGKTNALNLIHNNIKYLPHKTLENCSSAAQLDLSYNRLKNVSCLTFLTPSNLSALTIEHNLLKQVPSCHHGRHGHIFPQLRSISFRYNRIWSVASNAFSFAPNLRTLKLNINSIIFLNEYCFSGLRHLKTLRLDNNLITDLYNNSFLDLRNLSTLLLRNNRISVIFENVFQDLENLIILDLGGNKITQVKSGSFMGMKRLAKLYLDNNQIKKISGEMFDGVEATLQVLDLTSNMLRFQSRNYFAPFSNLSKVYDLKLQSQQPHGLTAIPKGFFTGLHSLRDLYLGQNRLTHLGHDVFDPLSNLTFLNLGEDCNGVQNLSPGIFKNLVNLKFLDLENMCIQSLDSDIFSNLSSLTRLQLTKNGLKHIDISIFGNMTNLRYLDIWKCPLTCTCDNKDLPRWMNVSHVQVVYAYNITCSNDHSVYFHNFDTHVCDLEAEKLILLGCSFTFLCLLIIIPIVYSKSYWRFKYNYFLFISWLNERWSSNKELYKYDAFVSYNTRDEAWVYETMLPMLERCPSSKGLRLCLHHRDFQLGRDIVDNIVDSIHNSRKTLCVVSRSYLRSEWCSMEMQLASYKLFDEMRDVLVLVFLEEIPLRELSTYHRMRKVMLKKTYITWPKEPEAQKLFWAKVRKALRGIEEENDQSDLVISDNESPLI